MKRLLIVTDVRGWAWHFMAEGIAANSGDVEVSVVDQHEFGVLTKHTPFLLGYFAGVCQCSWTESDVGDRLPLQKSTTWLASHGFEHPWPVPEDAPAPHRIATRIRNRANAAGKLPQFSAVLCVSRRIFEAASQITNNCIRVVPGIDERLFCATDIGRREKLVVGWCGQHTGVTKGYSEVLKPLQKMLGDQVQWRINDRSAGNPLSREEMVHWFHDIDVFVSTSCSEGFQMPVLEAASCGRPVIATDVGAADEVVRDRESGCIIPGWTDADTARETAAQAAYRIAEYANNRDLLRLHGASSRRLVERSFCWSQTAPAWLEAML